MSKAYNLSVERSTWSIWSSFVSVTNKKLIFVLAPEIKSCAFYEIFEPQRQNVLESMCAQRRLRSAFAFAQSDQNCRIFTGARFFFIAKYEKSLLADKEDPDQTAPMLRLIRDLVGHKCQKVRFLTLWLF